MTERERKEDNQINKLDHMVDDKNADVDAVSGFGGIGFEGCGWLVAVLVSSCSREYRRKRQQREEEDKKGKGCRQNKTEGKAEEDDK